MLLPLTVKAGAPVLRGEDFVWAQIREAGRNNRHFTASEIDQASNGRDRRLVTQFLRRLVKAGFVEAVGWTETALSRGRRMTPARIYRLLKRPHETPRLKRDGTPLSIGMRHQPMWNAMRALGTFTARELAVTATTEEVAVSTGNASKYARHLAAAGYLVAVAGGGERRRTTWRLKPSMNSGPRAPRLLVARLVYDPNRETIVNPVVAEEVTL